MRIPSKLVAATLVTAAIAAPMLGRPAATAAPIAGGCYGGHLASTNVPGTGSAGIDTAVTGSLLACHSPQLRGIVAGTLNLTYPLAPSAGSNTSGSSGGSSNANPADGTIAWSNGQVSTVSGSWAMTPIGVNAFNVLNIYRGPAAGLRMQIVTRQLVNTGSADGGSGSILGSTRR